MRDIIARLIGVIIGLIIIFEYTLITQPAEVERIPAEKVINVNFIQVEEKQEEPIFIDNTVYVDYEEAQILMRIAEAEATAGDIKEKAYIMAVVLNRVASEDFPNTVKEVVYQDNQFSPIDDGRYNEVEITTDTHLALASIEMGLYRDFEALYFENCKSDSWQSRNLELYYTSELHRFYK